MKGPMTQRIGYHVPRKILDTDMIVVGLMAHKIHG